MRTLLRTLRVRLRASPPRLYRPDFSDERFFAALRMTGAGHLGLSFARDAHRAGDSTTATSAVADHFRRRAHPRFLIDIQAIPDVLARAAREHPEWKRDVVEEVMRECRDGLSVLGTRTSPLRDVFDWSGPPSGPGDDRLHTVWPHFFAFAPRMALTAAYGVPVRPVLHGLLHRWMELAVRGGSAFPYLSDLTAGLRIVALSWAWAFTAGVAARGGQDDGALEFAILKVLRADGEFLEPLLDEATPNNHKLTAAFVLWYLGTLFPEFDSARSWRERGQAVCLDELGRQTLPDGGDFGHALAYHFSACEAAAVFVLLGQRNGEDVPSWVLARTRRALEFHVAVRGAGRRPFGDSADYPLFPLHGGAGCPVASLGELGRAMFGADFPAAPPNHPGAEHAFWLLGGALAPAGPEPEPTFSLRPFSASGCYLFTSRDAATELLFRTGPSPAQALFAGHMHADLLSVYLTSRGQPLLVEAGTYTYRTAAGPWRPYFAGPEAHNGLAIAGHDPLGTVTGDFRPRAVSARVDARWAASPLMAWVEGRVRDAGVYTGCRRGVVALDLGFWIVYDILGVGAPLSDASYAFQLEPGADVRATDGSVEVDVDRERLMIVPSEGLRAASIECGRREPTRGWVSRRYGELVAAPQIRFSTDGTRRDTAFVLVQTDVRPRCHSVTIELLAGGGIAIEVDWSDVTDRIVITHGDRPMSAFGGDFDGTLLWVRSRGSQPLALRWVDGRSVSFPALGVDVRAPHGLASIGIEMTPDGPRLTGSTDGIAIRWPGQMRPS